jgi:O-succinylbenzoate synthase
VPVGGSIATGAPAVDEALLEATAAPPDRVDWWRRRVEACHARLAAG